MPRLAPSSTYVYSFVIESQDFTFYLITFLHNLYTLRDAMRNTLRLFAEVSRQPNYLHIGAPTGLTGITTHRSPRPHLLYLYNQTLSALSQLPPNSVYRQSTEALTRHRLAAVEATVPAGLEEWRSRIAAHVEEHKGRTRALCELMLKGKGYLPQDVQTEDERLVEWDDDIGTERAEGPRGVESQGVDQAKDFGQGVEVEEQGKVHPTIEDEPALTADQCVATSYWEERRVMLTSTQSIEDRARDWIWSDRGSHQCCSRRAGARGADESSCCVSCDRIRHPIVVRLHIFRWEKLEERSPEGQWDYFQRHRHTGTTQAP